MKATLRIRDIGGLAGSHSYVLESGKLNVVESSNAGGKTSVVRALVSVLSVPKTGDFDANTLDEAFRLGIKTDPKNPREGFVNIHAEKAEVELELDDKQERYSVSKNGEYIVFPDMGDQRFLLTGLLSNDSRVTRQLHGLEDYEPDDFKWAVTLLSNAKGYDLVSQKLKNVREDLAEKRFMIRRTIKQIEALSKEKSQLENKSKKLDEELLELRPRFSGIEPLLEKRSGISKDIDDLTVKIGDKRGEIGRITKEQLEIPKQRIKKAEEKKQQIQEELANLKIDELEKARNLKGPEIESEVNRKRAERSDVDGLLNLFVTAESSLQQKQLTQLICPLCEDGKLDKNRVKEKITELRNQRQKLNKKILELTRLKFGIERQLEDEKNRAERLKEELLAAEEDISNALESMREPERAIRSIESTIHGYEQGIGEKKSLLAELTKRISKSDEQVNKEYTEKESERSNTSLELGKVLQQIGQLSSVEIFGMVVEPHKAEVACEELLEVVTDLVSYTEKRAEQERQEAARQFNTNIQTLMKNLGFTDFRNVQLNKDYRLYVERLNPDTRDYVYQQPKTLSTSEKLAIALVLQLALKETYMNHVPFFILDDIIEAFDEDRTQKVIDYLVKKAQQEGLFIVITKLVEELGLPKVRYIPT